MTVRFCAAVVLLAGAAGAAAAEPAPAGGASALRAIDGRPSLVADGGRLTALYSETFPTDFHARNRQMAGAGVNVFFLCVQGGYGGDYFTSWFWRDDGVYGDESDRPDDLSIDRQAREILAVRPDARFIVRWSSEVPKAWGERHPDHLQAGESRRLPKSSYASALALRGRAELARRIVRHAESRPWGARVLGYAPFGQDEGTSELSIQEALFDQAPVMQEAFAADLKAAYGTDEALRAAWGDPAASLASGRVPSDSEWRAARARWMHWPDPKALRRYRDYFGTVRRCALAQRKAELVAVKEAAGRPVFAAMDALKQPMSGWLIRDAFGAAAFGMDFRNILLASGSVGVGEVLDWPELDALITPADYTARAVGFGFEPEGIADPLVLRGKTLFVEDDARSWASPERDTQGAWRTPAECRAGLLRNLASAASRGHLPYWMNVGPVGYFNDPVVLKTVAEQVPVRARLLARPLVPTEHAIAMVLDDESPLDEDFTSGFQHLAVLRQRVDHLARTGLPYRVHLWSDVARPGFPRFRAYLLPNLFRLTPERVRLVREKLLRDGSVLIFGPGTGITDGERLGSGPASDLLGFPLELAPKASARRVLAAGGHPALADLRSPEVFGDSYVYGPVLLPARDLAPSGAVELGTLGAWWEANRAGLVLKEFGGGAAGGGAPGPRGPGDGAVVFSAAVPIPAPVLRALALYGGCVPWSDLGDVVAADGGMVAVHGVRPGPRTVRLPRACAVRDAVTGEDVGQGIDRFTIELKSPDTRVFFLD